MAQASLMKAIAVLALLGLASCATTPKIDDALTLKKTSFSKLEGWADHDPAPALAAFRKSCDKIMTAPDDKRMGPHKAFGKARDWKDVCFRASAMATTNGPLVRAFVEEYFVPYRAIGPKKKPEGLITGYYEPVMEGSFVPLPGYDVPLYARPADLVTVDLEQFRADLKGRRIAGRVVDGKLVPFSNRTEIENGALKNKKLELMWLKDPVDSFFLHIQGSGRVRLPNGDLQMVGYAGPNGHPYTAIGAILIERGEIAREDMSMQAIRAWLETHSDQAVALMRENKSYVFFRLLNGEGPIGAQGVALTPMRSLAVDQTLWAYGVPIWVDGTHPDPDVLEEMPQVFRNLMIAQDTGGAIRGTVRGDVFWGMGEQAEHIAGHMANKATFTVLLPKTLQDGGM